MATISALTSCTHSHAFALSADFFQRNQWCRLLCRRGDHVQRVKRAPKPPATLLHAFQLDGSDAAGAHMHLMILMSQLTHATLRGALEYSQSLEGFLAQTVLICGPALDDAWSRAHGSAISWRCSCHTRAPCDSAHHAQCLAHSNLAPRRAIALAAYGLTPARLLPLTCQLRPQFQRATCLSKPAAPRSR